MLLDRHYLAGVGSLVFMVFGQVVGLPEEYNQRIRTLVDSNPYQLSVQEYTLIAKTLWQKGSCNMLIFGVGNDSALWLGLNSEGNTIFLEDDENWLQYIRKQLSDINAYLVKYDTKRFQWKDLLKESNRNLLLMDLPGEIYDTKWDIIFVDAPAGYEDMKPGRMKSIYMASLLAYQHNNTVDVFVHDCDRIVEATYCTTFLGDEYLQTTLDRLRHYVIPN